MMEIKKLISLLKFYKKNEVEVELIIKIRGGIVVRGKIIKLNKIFKKYVVFQLQDNSFVKVFIRDIVLDTLLPTNLIQIEEKKEKKKKERNSISPKLRFDVFRRDKFVCQYCGACGPNVELEVDHIIPISRGGTDEMSNLKTTCFDCNRGKGDRI